MHLQYTGTISTSNECFNKTFFFSNKLNQFKFILGQTDLLPVLFFHDEVVLGFVQPV